jgi:hypothetical protein
MGERRTGTVTVLCSDLVGSTELMARLEATAYDDRIHQTLELGLVVSPGDADRFFVIQLGAVLTELERLDELAERLDGLPNLPANRYFAAMLALAHAQANRLDKARRIFAPISAQGFTDLGVNAAWLPTLAACAHVAVRLRDAAAGRALLGYLSPFTAQLLAPALIPWGSVAYFAALAATAAGRLDEAAALFDDAEAAHVRLGAAFMAQRTRDERARWLG